ncbi:MAG TPA: hypothetical protein VJR67_01910 [Candidatus Nitrosopolaris sp.]|nr:hypothetical protein [Candidatus Nitrosopolaris sp.]
MIPEERRTGLTVWVHDTRGSDIASKLIGHFVLNAEKFRFTAIAFGRIGGHNVSLRISKKSADRIRGMGFDPDDVELAVQRKIIEGDVVLPQGLHLRE